MTPLDVMNLPAAKLEGFCSRRDSRELIETAYGLDAYAAGAAFAAAYLHYRAAGVNHAAALRRANAARRGTRRSLGYNITPDIKV